MNKTWIKIRTAKLSLFVILSLLIAGAPVAAEQPVVEGAAAILVDADSGQVLWSRNAHARKPMASTTKVMTTLLALELGNLDDVVTIPKGVDKIQESSFHLIPGEKMTLRDLLYATMVRSANDAAVVVGRHIAGSDAGFIRLMNQRARQLGMKDTAFKNPNGLHASGHYSSVHDLAVLAREAASIPMFNALCSTRSHFVKREKSKDELLVSKVKFLKDYEGADGMKTGYTRQAGRCFIGSATRGGWRLISVVLKSPDPGKDTVTLMDHGFSQFERVTLASAGEEFSTVKVPGGSPRDLPLVLENDLVACVLKGQEPEQPLVEIGYVQIPINRGDKIGEVVARVQGKPVARATLVAATDVVETRGRSSALLIFGMAVVPAAYVAVRRGLPVR